MKKIDLYLLGEKGYRVLNEIIVSNKAIIGNVVIGKDKNIKNDYSKEIEEICKENKISYFFLKEHIEKNDNYKFAIGWRWLIKDSNNLIVLHDSLLPKYRGFAPLVNGLINGEKQFGVTALFASSEYDKGRIIAQKKLEISYPKKINELIKDISKLYIDISVYIIEQIKTKNKIESYIQNEKEATYSLWRDEEDYYVNWNESASKIKRFVDAVGDPYFGALTYLNEKKIRLEEVEEYPDVTIENRENNIGKIIFMLEEIPIVICKNGLLKIKKAYFVEENKLIFPLKKFRSRFSNFKGGKI